MVDRTTFVKVIIIKCYGCGKPGHISTVCTYKNGKGKNIFNNFRNQTHYVDLTLSFEMENSGSIPKSVASIVLPNRQIFLKLSLDL